MKSFKSLLWLLPIVLGLCACNKSDEESITEEADIQVTTGDAQDVSLTSVTVQGTVNSASMNYSEVGIAYCLESSNGDISYAKAANVGSGRGRQTFTVTINGLQPDAAYTYYAYAKATDGKMANAKERKTFHTESPLWLLKFNAIQWIATTDATLTWTLPNNEVLNVLKESRLNASFGIAWSTDPSKLTPSGNSFAASTQALVFNQGLRGNTRIGSLSPATKYYYVTYVSLNGKLYVAPVSNFSTLSENIFAGTAPSHVEAVDLGLPSGTKWANVNIGADTAEENGKFFAWGETEGYQVVVKMDGDNEIELFDRSFDWTEYKWCNRSQTTLTKYCNNSSYGTVDNKVTLDLADDAGYINWGDNWRMPTADDVEELFSNTRSEWTKQNGVEGYNFTSLKTGKSIFLPAAGCAPSKNHYDEGVRGYYWSSSINTERAYTSSYTLLMVAGCDLGVLPRYYGMTIRPVYRK